MAYMSQEHKAEIQPVVKAILKKYKLKGSLRVRHHSTLILTIKSGTINFNKEKVNTHWIDRDHTGIAKEALTELSEALKGPNYFDETDIITDYFHTSHYTEIKIGSYEKAYELK